MKVLVIGAAGKTGIEVVNRALAAGHQVTAFVHKAADAHLPANVCIVEGDATNATALENAVEAQDAVIDALGGKTPYKETTLEATTARNAIAAMRKLGVRRLIVTSMLGEGDSRANAPFFYERLLMPTFLHGATPDKAAMEAEVKATDLDWIILRPAILTDGEATGNVRIFSADTSEKAHKISRADLAEFIVQQLTSDTCLHQAVTIATS